MKDISYGWEILGGASGAALGVVPSLGTCLQMHQEIEVQQLLRLFLYSCFTSVFVLEWPLVLFFFFLQKLKAIEQLKEQAAAGKQLEKNQVRLRSVHFIPGSFYSKLHL